MGFLKKAIIKRLQTNVHPKKQLRFLKRLYILLTKGYSLVDALKMMSYDNELRDIAVQIELRLMEGESIDCAFKKAKFHSTITSYLYFVRLNSNLEESLRKCIEMFEQRVTNYEKLTRVLRYPVMLFTMFVILLIVIKTYILPTFIDLFETHHESSIMMTYFILFIDLLSTLFLLLIFLIIGIGFVWNRIKKMLPIEKQLLLYKKLPIYRRFLIDQTTFFFATHMSMLLKTGMSIKNVLSQLASQKELPIISYYASLMVEQLKNGKHYSSLLHELYFIEAQLAHIFQEDSNKEQLEKDLSSFSDMLAERIEQKMMKALAIIQPVFFITLGCFIIFIYGTLMWPMLELIKSV